MIKDFVRLSCIRCCLGLGCGHYIFSAYSVVYARDCYLCFVVENSNHFSRTWWSELGIYRHAHHQSFFLLLQRNCLLLFVCQDERQAAEGYKSVNKESTPVVLDPGYCAEDDSNSMIVKVPLRLTSLNFDTIVPSALAAIGSRHSHYHGSQASSHSFGSGKASSQNGSLVKSHADSRRSLFSRFTEMGPLIQRKNGRGENKLFVVPFQTFLRSMSPTSTF